MNPAPTLLFQNEDFIGFDKPAGWYSVPAREPKPGDLVLSDWIRGNPEFGAAFMIHRLDRFTSGAILIAKNERAHKLGNLWFERRIAKKQYLFIGSPVPSKPAIQMKTPVDGKPAQTLFEVLGQKGSHFLGKATPLTGRFHQIREHAKQAGFPIVGDETYGGIKAARVFLHAAILETPLGVLHAPLAKDMEQFWEGIHA